LYFLQKSIFFMREMGNLVLILTGEIDDFCLLFVVVLAQVIDHFFLCVEDLFHTCTFRFKGFRELFYLLILEKSISVSLILNFFELNFV
jgi:hypothetical protein